MNPDRSALDRRGHGLVDLLDRRGDALFEGLRGRRGADLVFYAATWAGEFSAIWHALALLRILRGHRRSALRATVGLAGESVLVNGVIKSLFRRPRPVDDSPRPLPLRRPLTTSFPSGHASAAAFAALVLGEGSSSWPLYAGIAVLVATSRIYVRIHHTSDVLGGAVLGAGLGFLWRRAVPIGPRTSCLGPSSTIRRRGPESPAARGG